MLDAADPTPRHAIYRALHPLLRSLSPAQRAAALAQLQAWAGVDATARPTHRALQPGEVAALAVGGLVEVGAHTVNHPVLAALPPAVQRAEIVESQARLSALTGRPVTSFSYPYGAPGDYTAETVALVREAGFTCACANFAGRVEPGVDPFALPRFIVRDWDFATFASMLEAWFGD
ncbi:MAG: polysaccharide deacetylase family protein [Anaerolineae bacterium]|nr:polysaccharide deacetylase family protein [Anaerolineae bacterium]